MRTPRPPSERPSPRPAARLRAAAAAIATLAATALAAGCGGPAFDGHVYHGEGFAFRVPDPPASWTPLEVTGTSLAFRDASGGTIAVNGRCGADGDDVPLAALTQHLFLQFTDREITTQEVVPFDGREAMHTELSAKLDGVPNRFDVWVLKKDGCVYDLYYFAAPERFDADKTRFDAFVHGFATVHDAR